MPYSPRSDVNLFQSTNLNIRYLYSNFLPIVEVDTEETNPNLQSSFDIFDPDLTSLLDSLTAAQLYRYQGFEHMPTLVRRLYNTTTLWWLVMKYNGFYHEWEIPAGGLMYFPVLQQIDTGISAMQASGNRGIVVSL